MQKKSFESMKCMIAKSLDQVGEWWSLLIIRECSQGATRFEELRSALGIARNILATRLERLVELEILERFPLAEKAATFGYRLTQKGEELFPVLVAFMHWGDKWLAGHKAPITLVDKETGKPIEKLTVRAADGRELAIKDVLFAPGPGATQTTQVVIDARNHRVIG